MVFTLYEITIMIHPYLMPSSSSVRIQCSYSFYKIYIGGCFLCTRQLYIFSPMFLSLNPHTNKTYINISIGLCPLGFIRLFWRPKTRFWRRQTRLALSAPKMNFRNQNRSINPGGHRPIDENLIMKTDESEEIPSSTIRIVRVCRPLK